MTITLEEESTFPTPSASDHLVCKLVAVDRQDINPIYDRYNDGYRYSFTFQILEGHGNDSRYSGNLWGNVPKNWDDKPSCKLRIWSQEILRADDKLEAFDEDALIHDGKPVIVMLREYFNNEGIRKVAVEDIRRYTPLIEVKS